MKRLFIIICATGLFLTSCASYYSQTGNPTSSNPGMASTTAGLVYTESNGDYIENRDKVVKNKAELLEIEEEKELKEAPQRKIIHNGNMRMKVTNKDSANIEVAKIAEKYKGFVLKSSNHYSTIRIPSKSFQNAISDISALGVVKDKNITGNDVTEQYLDLGIRLDNAMKTRDRYLELLKKAANVTEALKVERELERLNNTIDRIKGKQERMKHLIAFSTLTVRYDQKTILGPLGYIGLGVFKACKALFVIKS